MEEYYVAVILRRFVDHGHIVVYRVAHLAGRSCFDETLKSTAHGGTVVNNEESGPLRAGHGRENLLRRAAKNDSTEISYFSALRVATDKSIRSGRGQQQRSDSGEGVAAQ